VPTENDKRQATSWDNMGLRDLTKKAGIWTIKESDTHNVVDISIENEYLATAPHVFTTQVSFKIIGDGTIFVNSIIEPAVKNVIIPKVGFVLEMPQEYDNFQWYGRGPWDSYADRKEACFEGVYSSKVAEQWVDYVLPQEMGNKEEVRWLSLTNNEGSGILFVAPEQMAVTVSNWRAQDMYTTLNNRVKHPYQMPFRESTVVCLDARNRPLGNASCGPDVMDKYELRAETTVFNFILMPISQTQTPEQLSKMARVESQACAPVKIENDTQGRIVLTTTTPKAGILYSLNDGEFITYTTPFELLEGGHIKAYCKSDGYFDSMISEANINMFVDKHEWSVVSYSSQAGGEEVYKAIDGDVNTYWHTSWGDYEPSHPHEVIIDMKETFRVEAFIYQGRQDGDNGRISEYEIFFSNSATQWGSPAAVGKFTNSSNPQRVQLPAPLDARYFRLVVKSEVNGRAWASAAEIGIEASAVVEPVIVNCLDVEEKQKYYIKHVNSGLYLQFLPDVNANYQGDFCLNPLLDGNESFFFGFTSINGMNSVYNVSVSGGFINMGQGGWRCSIGPLTNIDGMVQLEVENDCTHRFRGLWEGANYFGLDASVAGSYIYADKFVGAIWQLERIGEFSFVEDEEFENTNVYPTVTKGSVTILSAGQSTIKLMDISGRVLNQYYSEGKLTIELNCQDGWYFVVVEGQRKTVHKVLLFS